MAEDEKNLQRKESSSDLEHADEEVVSSEGENRSPEELFTVSSTGERIRVRRLGHAPKPVEKRKTTVNVLDLIIIVAVVAVIVLAVLAVRFGGEWFGSDSVSRTIEYVVVFRDVDDEFAEAISKGDAVYHTAQKQQLGQVFTEAEVDPFTYVQYRAPSSEEENGAAVFMTYPDRVNLTVTVRVKADYSEETGYSVEGIRIAVGAEYSLRFPNFTGICTCIAVNDNLS